MIDIDVIIKADHRRNRVGNCTSDREPWPCRLLRACGEIERLTAEAEQAARRLREAHEQRAEALMRLASANDEKNAYRHQRDQARALLAELQAARERAVVRS